MAVPDESDAALCEFRLNSYDELITFDIPGVIAHDPRTSGIDAQSRAS
jgi:hypothetical protein